MEQPPIQPGNNTNLPQETPVTPVPPAPPTQGNQPYLQYPPQYPPYAPYAQPGQEPPKKKKRRGWLIAAIVIVVALFVCIGVTSLNSKGGTTSSTSSPPASTGKTTGTTSGGTTAQKWTTVQTFKGTGSKKTASFSVPDHWKLDWSCNPSSFSGVNQYNVIAMVEGSDSSIVDPGVNAMCKAGNTSGETEIYTAGDNVHLNIISEGDWTFTIKELK